jgi:hypothetical protein
LRSVAEAAVCRAAVAECHAAADSLAVVDFLEVARLIRAVLR